MESIDAPSGHETGVHQSADAVRLRQAAQVGHGDQRGCHGDGTRSVSPGRARPPGADPGPGWFLPARRYVSSSRDVQDEAVVVGEGTRVRDVPTDQAPGRPRWVAAWVPGSGWAWARARGRRCSRRSVPSGMIGRPRPDRCARPRPRRRSSWKRSGAVAEGSAGVETKREVVGLLRVATHVWHGRGRRGASRRRAGGRRRLAARLPRRGPARGRCPAVRPRSPGRYVRVSPFASRERLRVTERAADERREVDRGRRRGRAEGSAPGRATADSRRGCPAPPRCPRVDRCG